MKHACSLLFACGAAFLSANAFAATFLIPDHDVAALKAALGKSNSNAQDDVIHLAPSGVYTLTAPDSPDGGLPDILPDGGRKVTIVGHGTRIERSAVQGTLPFRLLYVMRGGDLTLEDIALTNGSASLGGAILNDQAKLQLTRCTVTRNSAQVGGAIYNACDFGNATLTLTDCTFSENVTVPPTNFGTHPRGGAIYNAGENGSAALVITGCTFARNSSDHGGAIYNDGFFGNATLRIRNATFSENSARYYGGAIFNIGDFGSAPLRVVSATFSRNSAGALLGGAIYNTGESSTAATEIGNSIFLSGVGTNLFNRNDTIGTFAPVVSLGYNVINDDNDGAYGPTGLLNAASDQRGTDPLLDPAGLRDNGGPTKTITLLPGSPAIDKGRDLDGAGRDQRGFPRPHDFVTIPPALGGDNSDSGALEMNPDADGDGIPDDLDHCPHSDLRPTVWVRNINSGVPNDLLSDGCTIADLVAAASVNPRNRGDFVSAIAHLTNDLVKQGILTGQKKGALQSSAAKAALP